MGDKPDAFTCPCCKRPLEVAQVVGRPALGACSACGKRIRTDGCYQEAMALATANEGWIEKVFWTDQTEAILPTIVALAIEFPLTVFKYVGPLVVLLSMYFLRGDPFTAAPGMPWRTWLLIPAAVLAGFLVFWLVRWAIHRSFPNQFATQANFIVSSRGIILVAHRSEPFMLPWSAIRSYGWSSQVQDFTSQVVIEYAAADNGVRQVVLHGEEKRQPLGEVFEILDARLGKRG